MKHRRNLWWTKRKEQFVNFLVSERKEEDVEKKGRERNDNPRTKQFLGRSGRWLFLLLILMQNWFCVGAAAGRLEPKRRSGSAGNHYRVGCGGRHFRKPGWQKPSGGAEGKVLERVEAVKRS